MKINTLLFTFLFCLPFLGFSQQLISDSIIHDGLTREYILYVPDSYTSDEPVPLILNYHGYTASAIIQVAYGDFRPIADTAGFLVVHPMGTEDQFGNTHWNVGWTTSDVDDVGFTAALIDSLSETYNINQKQVYSTGMSNGGFFSYRLACELSDRIAGIASVTGTMNLGYEDNCNTLHPMPVMEIHGTADPVVFYNGSFFTESIPNVLAYWANFNNCDPEPIITEVPDIDPNDGSTVEHHVYPNGDRGVTVEHFKVLGGGHTWPGTELGGSTTNYDIDASVEIWKFFSRYDIDGLINISTTGEGMTASKEPVIYPNPSNSFVTVELRTADTKYYELLGLDGTVLQKGTVHHSLKIDLTGLPDGLYLLRLGDRMYKVVKTG